MNWRVNPSAVSIFWGGGPILVGTSPFFFVGTLPQFKKNSSWQFSRRHFCSWKWLFRDPLPKFSLNHEGNDGCFVTHAPTKNQKVGLGMIRMFFPSVQQKMPPFQCVWNQHIDMYIYIYIIFRGKTWNLTWTVIMAASGAYFFQLMPYVLGSKLPLFPYNRGWSSTQ